MADAREKGLVLPVPESQSPNGSPEHVVMQTGVLVPMYVKNELDDKELARNFFRTFTSGYIEDATKGFFVSPDLVRSNQPPSLIRAMVSASKAFGLTEGSFEHERIARSYGLACAIFQEMPRMTCDTVYTPDIVISNALILMPPRNPSETLARFNELRRFVGEVSEGYISHLTLARIDDATLRSFAFFQVGKDLLTYFQPPMPRGEITRERPI